MNVFHNLLWSCLSEAVLQRPAGAAAEGLSYGNCLQARSQQRCGAWQGLCRYFPLFKVLTKTSLSEVSWSNPPGLQRGESGARPCGQRVPGHRVCRSSGAPPRPRARTGPARPLRPPLSRTRLLGSGGGSTATSATPHLHGIEPARLAAQVHLPEGAAADGLNDGELLDGGRPGDLDVRRAGGCGGAGASSIAALARGRLGCHGAPGPGPAAIQSGPARQRRHQRQRELSRDPARRPGDAPAMAELAGESRCSRPVPPSEHARDKPQHLRAGWSLHGQASMFSCLALGCNLLWASTGSPFP